METLYNELREYLKFLTREQNLMISIHDRCGFMQDYLKIIIEYSIHSCEYCMHMKADKKRWNACHIMQNLVTKKCREARAFFGVCYAGVGEYVFPVICKEKVVAFVSAGGYRTKEALVRLKRSAFSDEETLSLYEKLKEEIPPPQKISAVINPLCRMIELIYERSDFDFGVSPEKNYVYSHIVAYISQHYQDKITLNDICEFCHYSQSYVSHMFKRESGMTLGTYINQVRIHQAKKLLRATELRIKEVAAGVGFEEPNYFAGVFKKMTGMTANDYRRQYRKQQETGRVEL